MDVAERKRFAHAFAEAGLAIAGLEITLLTLRDKGVLSTTELTEILHRLRGVVREIEAGSSAVAEDVVETMNGRLKQMARYLAVDLREN